MLTDKERMELINLRKRVADQREQIKKLEERRKYELGLLRSRCYPGAEEYFDKKLYGLLKIVKVSD